MDKSDIPFEIRPPKEDLGPYRYKVTARAYAHPSPYVDVAWQVWTREDERGDGKKPPPSPYNDGQTKTIRPPNWFGRIFLRQTMDKKIQKAQAKATRKALNDIDRQQRNELAAARFLGQRRDR